VPVDTLMLRWQGLAGQRAVSAMLTNKSLASM
jgi:hypothetical protein